MKPSVRLSIAAVLMGLATTASAVEWGVAGVLSQQGQRLKVAVPFETAEGLDLSVVQFRVVRSAAPAGSFSPEPGMFTISKAPGTGMVLLQSEELVYANQIDLVLQVVDRPEKAVRYDLRIPGN